MQKLREKISGLRRCIPRPLALLLVMIAVPLMTTGCLALIWNYYERSVAKAALMDERGSADAIVIFGAATAGQGQPGTILRARINHALALYREGCAGSFILTGGVGWGPPAESVVMKRILSENGISDSRIFFETQSSTTREQVDFAVETAAQNNWTKLLVVSDPYHLYRISRYFKKTGLQLLFSPAREVQFNDEESRLYIRAEILKLIAWDFLGS
jgi:uncharacterized SAM-binding protein YcdF (DUF218 family)